MGKKLRDEEWDRLFEEQFLKEADVIEEELFSGDALQDVEEETEEEVQTAYEDLVARLRARGEYREEDETEAETEAEAEIKAEAEIIEAELEDDEAAMAEKVIPMPDSRKTFRTAKVAGFAIVGVLCVFAATMSGEANRKYFVDSVRFLAGDDTRMTLSNDENNARTNTDEYEAIKDIEEKMGIEMPELFYKPNGFKFSDYEINEIAQFALIEYEYKENVLALYCQKKDNSSASMNFGLHGDKTPISNFDNGQICGEILELKAEGDILPSYMVQWERNDVSYQFSGKIDKEECLKIVKKLDSECDFGMSKSYIIV